MRVLATVLRSRPKSKHGLKWRVSTLATWSVDFLEYGMARLVRVLQLGDCYDTAFVAIGEIALARANAGHRSWKVLRQACDDVETRVQPNGPRA